MDNLAKWFGVVLFICAFLFFFNATVEIYKEFTGYDLLSDGGSGYEPVIAGYLKYTLSVSLAVLMLGIAGMVFDKDFRVRKLDGENYDLFLFCCGNLIFFTFNILKEKALISYVENGLVESVSFILDVLVIFGLWWSLSQVKKHKIAKEIKEFTDREANSENNFTGN